MRKRVRSYVCLVLFLVMCLNFSAMAINDNDSKEVKATANYSYETYIYTSGVTIGVDNYSCLISYETLEILPMVLTKEGNSLVYHDGNTLKSGDSVTINPNNWAHVADRGYYYYVECGALSGYVYEKYIVLGHITVTCDANGGTISGSEDDTTYSFNVAVGDTYKTLPVAYRENYIFGGWYTSRTGGELVTEDTLVSGDSHTLYAHWHNKTCTVNFDLNGMTGTTPAQITVQYGECISLPQPDSVSGYTFLGWYFDDVKWESTTPVTNNIILLAKWEKSDTQPEQPPEEDPNPGHGSDTELDPFNFINDNTYFNAADYSVTGRYLQALKDTISAADWVDVQNLMSRSWSGACYGMSAVFILNYAGDLDPAYFQSGADRLYDLNYPKDSTTVKNLIHYYYLQQKTDYGSNSFYEYKVTNHYYNEELVHIMESGDYPVMISFFVGSSGHAVVGLDGARNSDGSYSVTIYDPNQWETDTLTVSADYSKISFASGKYSGSRGIFNNKAFSTRSATFDHANIQDYLTGGLAAVSDSSYRLSTSLTSFTVTDSSGKSAVIQNGDLSGNLDIQLSLDYESGEISYILPPSSSYTVTPEGSGYISLTVGEYNAQLNSGGVSSLTLTNDGKVTTAATKAVAQTITLTSDRVGSVWNSVAVSGTDAGFELSASDGTADVSSVNNVPVSVTGSNIYSGQIGASENIEASQDGTHVNINVANNGGTDSSNSIKATFVGNGEVFLSTTEANPGETVSIMVMPGAGYNVGSVIVTGPNGKVTVTNLGNLTYSFVMPNGDVTISVSFVLRSLPFTDVSAGAWYYDEVSYVYTNGLMEGMSDTLFDPNGGMTRAMVWAILARIDGVTVTGDNWAETARAWAMAEGVSDGENASAPVTREQLVTMLWRYAGEPEAAAGLTGWADAASVSDWAETAMAWSVGKGVIEGDELSRLTPAAGATRAQCAAILMRYVELG